MVKLPERLAREGTLVATGVILIPAIAGLAILACREYIGPILLPPPHQHGAAMVKTLILLSVLLTFPSQAAEFHVSPGRR